MSDETHEDDDLDLHSLSMKDPHVLIYLSSGKAFTLENIDTAALVRTLAEYGYCTLMAKNSRLTLFSSGIAAIIGSTEAPEL